MAGSVHNLSTLFAQLGQASDEASSASFIASHRPLAGHFMLQHEVQGEPNAVTHMEVLEVCGDLARYRLRPVTGQRHQLRVHMAALGLPILGDGLYPTLTPEGQLDYANPLQLLAKSVGFTDPVSGQARRFESERTLVGWV